MTNVDGPGQPRRRDTGHWSTIVSSLTAAVTAIVAIATISYDNQANRDQLNLARQGQITDRFSRAIDQLGREGDKELSMRLGGIYALERIMRDSETDVPAIVEVLCAFIREHTRTLAQPGPELPTDVQAALTVLGRRPNSDKAEFGVDPAYGVIELKGGTHLERAHLEKAHLEGAHLEGAHLDLVHFDGAFLRRAHLTNAVLYAAHLTDAHLEDADLSGVYLDGKTLSGVHLDGAVLFGAHLEGAVLSLAHGLTSEQLRCATTNADTKLPVGVSVPADRSTCGPAKS